MAGETKTSKPTEAELETEVLAVREKRLTLGKLLRLLPGGSLWAEADSDEARASELAVDIRQSMKERDLDSSKIEGWQKAARDSSDHLVMVGALGLVTEVVLDTVYLDLRRWGHDMELLTDFVPGESIAS